MSARLPSLFAFVVASGCSSITLLEADGGTGGADTGEAQTTGILSGASLSSAGDGGSSTSGTQEEESSSDDGPGSGFIATTGTSCAAGGGVAQCSLWDQDCCEGEACVPWANDGGSMWNATRCSPIAPRPDAVAQPCETEGNPHSGVDSCEFGAVCWNADPDTLQGECVALCGGTPDAPACADGTDCLIANDGALTLCLPSCDPIGANCGEGEACYPTAGMSFVCVPEEYVSCPAQTLPSADGTCADVCNFAAESPCDEGFVCSPYFEGGAGDVGTCVAVR